MPKHTLPAHVIAARGRKINLMDGSTPTIVFTFSSVMRLEDEFGSIAGALEAIGGAADGEVSGAAFNSIAKLLAAGLEHETTVADDDGKGGGVPLSHLDSLRYLLDPAELQAYSVAIGEAFEAAFPSKGDSDETDPTKGADSSHGNTGTTSPPSSSDEPTQSSGA